MMIINKACNALVQVLMSVLARRVVFNGTLIELFSVN